jgi:hypothetical protein
MDKLLNQWRRLYSDDGQNDIDFTDHEEKLQEAKARLAGHAQELVRAAENLNRAAMAAGFPKGIVH